MATIAVCSLGGAPGVTTLAVALASTWPADVPTVLVEADAKGGDLGAWRRMPIEPGLVELATAARHDSVFAPTEGIADPFSRSQELPGGLRVCLAPATPDRAQGAVALLAQHPRVLHPRNAGVVVADLGRLVPRTSTAHLAAAPEIDAVVVVTSDDIAQLRRVRDSLAGLGTGIARLGVAVVGGRESKQQIAAALQAPVWAHIPLDARGAAVIRGQRSDPHPERRRLMAAAHHLGQRLAAEITPTSRPETQQQVS